jgi:hypothetical protein
LRNPVRCLAAHQAAQSATPDCAIGAFIGLHGQKRIKNNSDWRWSHFTVGSNFNLKMMLKIDFEEIKTAYGLIKDINGFN